MPKNLPRRPKAPPDDWLSLCCGILTVLCALFAIVSGFAFAVVTFAESGVESGVDAESTRQILLLTTAVSSLVGIGALKRVVPLFLTYKR